jgi:exfoliative toxin A/B
MMKRLLQALPIPISGLMLGLAALGNLLGPYSSSLRFLLGSISAIILIALLLKIIIVPGSVRENFSNPVIASIMATFPMGVMLLTTYVQPLIPGPAFALWLVAIGLNLLLAVIFTKTHLFPFNIKKVSPSFFVMYIGIVAASVTAPLYGMQSLGQLVFWIGLFLYIPLNLLVTYRFLKVGQVPEPVQPTLVIYAAPASLLLAGYLNSFPEKSTTLIIALGSWSFLMTLYGLSQMPRLLRLPFYPSCAAFTFPFVISAIAFNGMVKYLSGIASQASFLGLVANLQMVWAVLIVVYVLLRYTLFLAAPPIKAKVTEKA